jgi:DNA (cytosine-5)-methyltransferase 1
MIPNNKVVTWRAAEFFAGIGLARLGMSSAGIDVVWSNDISRTKHALFERNFGVAGEHHTFIVEDLGRLSRDKLPDDVDLAWASFPCTDLSVAGGRAGLHRGAASSTFWHFIKALSAMGPSRPAVVALENVTAFASSHSGRDIASAIRSLNGLGYSVDVLNIDARRFVPQSRPRLFLIGTMNLTAGVSDPSPLRPDWLKSIFEDPTLVTHQFPLPEPPPLLEVGLMRYLEHIEDGDERWWGTDRVASFRESLSELQLGRFEVLEKQGDPTVRTAYRRMRRGVPRWELRSDEVAGCLRTSSGGSSKQAVVLFGDGQARIRWMTPREYAYLMGAPDYPLDGVRDGHAYSGFGDAVCAPVVEWLSVHYLLPLLSAAEAASSASRLDESVPVAS